MSLTFPFLPLWVMKCSLLHHLPIQSLFSVSNYYQTASIHPVIKLTAGQNVAHHHHHQHYHHHQIYQL